MFLRQRWARVVGIVVTLVVVHGATDGLGFGEPSLLISADGILDESLMPITYLILDGASPGEELGSDALQPELHPEGRSSSADVQSMVAANGSAAGPLTDASYASALSTLGFHRTMINLYRCKGFLARQILDTYPSQPLLSRRMSAPGGPANFSAAMVMGTPRHTVDAMLYDQGSSDYKEWLTKTTTLDDIYENFRSSARLNGTAQSDGQPTSSPRLGQEEYFDEGIITGYAVQPDPPLGMGGGERNLRAGYYERGQGVHPATHPQRPGKLHRDLLEGEALGYDGSRGDYAYRHHHLHHPVIEYEEKSLDKGSLGLKDLFDIALTTLAYLSFGMFILQVIMCITMTKADTGMMILPTPTEVEVEEDERRRFIRALPDIAEPVRETVREQNRIAAHVLGSIDILVGDGPNRDTCLQAALCKANLFSRSITTINGYWISVWSFGVSWLSGCRKPSCSSPTFAMQCLSASLVGLGGGNCAKLYPCPTKQTNART